MVLKRSHIYMAQKLHAADSKEKGARTHDTHTHIHHEQNSSLGGGIPKEETQNANDIAAMWSDDMIVEMAPCGAGGVLLMHPFLVHAAGIAEIGHPMRIPFNMGVRWTTRDVHVGSDMNIEDEREKKDNIDIYNERKDEDEDNGMDADGTSSYHWRKKQRRCSLLEEMIDWCLHQKLLLGSSTTATTILDDAFKEEYT